MDKAKPKRWSRRDGTRVKQSHDLNALFPYIMKRRCDSVVFFSENLDVENVLRYVEEKRQSGDDVTFFQLFLLALTKLLRERPCINRFMKGRRLYQRENVILNFIAKREFSDEGSETNVTVRIKPGDDSKTILSKLRGEITSAKAGEEKGDDAAISSLMKLPRFMLMLAIKLMELMDFYRGIPLGLEKVDPLRSSAFVANLGSVGIDAPYHHLIEWGTNSLFIAIGRIQKMPCVLDDGTLGVKNMVNIKVTLDERIADGYYFARSLDMFKEYLKNPSSLETI